MNRSHPESIPRWDYSTGAETSSFVRRHWCSPPAHWFKEPARLRRRFLHNLSLTLIDVMPKHPIDRNYSEFARITFILTRYRQQSNATISESIKDSHRNNGRMCLKPEDSSFHGKSNSLVASAAAGAKKFTALQVAALAHPLDGANPIDPACYGQSKDAINGILTCDIDEETARVYGGPVWHASVCPPFRPYAEALLSGVGEGVLFEDCGLLYADVYHLRRRMTLEEIRQLGSPDPGCSLSSAKRCS